MGALCCVQWVGFTSVVLSIYIACSAEGVANTVGTLATCGVGVIVFGLLGFTFAKRTRLGLSVVCGCVSLVMETAMYGNLLLHAGTFPLALPAACVVGGGHALALALVGGFYAAITVAQRRLAAKINKEVEAVRRVQRTAEMNPLALVGARKLQAVVRGHRDRQLAVRSRELLAWHALSLERRVLVVVVYGSLFVLLAFCTYINLLYGVKFSTAQARAWVLASYLSFFSDAFVNKPIVILAKVVIKFGLRVLRSSVDATLVSRVVADRLGLKRGAQGPGGPSAYLADIMTSTQSY